MKLRFTHQNNSLAEYENWTHMLLNVINYTKSNFEKNIVHKDFGSSIQNALEKNQIHERENLEMQKSWIKILKEIENKSNELKLLKAKLEIIKSDLSTEDDIEVKEKRLKQEVKSLVDNIENMTEELDHLNLVNISNNNTADKETLKIINLLQEMTELEIENERLKSLKENIDKLDYNINKLSKKEDITDNKYDNHQLLTDENNENEFLLKGSLINSDINKINLKKQFINNLYSKNIVNTKKPSVSYVSCLNNEGKNEKYNTIYYDKN